MPWIHKSTINQGRIMKKSDFIQHWNLIEKDQKLEPCPIAYKHKGSTFDEDGIRILGSPEFIDSVLSRLKDLLDYENGQTRLSISHSEATDKNTGNPLGTYKVYIQVHERGHQARAINAMFGV